MGILYPENANALQLPSLLGEERLQRFCGTMDDGFVFGVQTFIKPQKPEMGIGFRPVLLYTVTRKTKLDKAACSGAE